MTRDRISRKVIWVLENKGLGNALQAWRLAILHGWKPDLEVASELAGNAASRGLVFETSWIYRDARRWKLQLPAKFIALCYLRRMNELDRYNAIKYASKSLDVMMRVDQRFLTDPIWKQVIKAQSTAGELAMDRLVKALPEPLPQEHQKDIVIGFAYVGNAPRALQFYRNLSSKDANVIRAVLQVVLRAPSPLLSDVSELENDAERFLNRLDAGREQRGHFLRVELVNHYARVGKVDMMKKHIEQLLSRESKSEWQASSPGGILPNALKGALHTTVPLHMSVV
ncbi:hypothetical protein NDN08_003413 [Rhodosorus marinus]|uniref:Uncharacterized protein n=1 Tax=Rhodosorus marinus TaxID=101924 RepID=A0AAV8UWN0_9RHOD|nr:hypothetical protein NDN08_003413 [Rhodosorus marinus]